MVTASHNPAQYNGFKITLGDGLPVGEATGMGEIKELVCHSEYNEESLSSPSAREGVGGVGADASGNSLSLPLGKREMTKKDVLPDYLKKVFSIVPPNSIQPMKIVIDAGNGMAKVSIPEVLKIYR